MIQTEDEEEPSLEFSLDFSKFIPLARELNAILIPKEDDIASDPHNETERDV